MTAHDFRRLALYMPGAIESAHMGHPDFRANGRIFATLHSNDAWGMVKLEADEQAEFMRASPTMFEPSSGAWGRQGCTNVRLDAADPQTMRAAMTLAWQHVADKPTAKKPGAARRAGPAKKRRARY